jgi:trans-aconitate 2-methyltransferase
VQTSLRGRFSAIDLRTCGTVPTVQYMTDQSGEAARRYAFGDTNLAADRLATVAEVFAPTSRSFLSDFTQGCLDLALDLGCGPGHTTRLIAKVLRPRRAVGMDRSAYFVSLASSTMTNGISFVEHDVTAVPFPTDTADLIYCRFLLTHLAHPQSHVEMWSTQLKPGGILLLDEVEWIRTTDPVFGTYLEIVATMLDRQGNNLYVGSLLEAMPDPAGLQRRSSRLTTLVPASHQAAKMFLMNLRVWRNEPFVREAYEEETLSNLESDLAALAESGSSGGIVWGLRQLAYQRI